MNKIKGQGSSTCAISLLLSAALLCSQGVRANTAETLLHTIEPQQLALLTGAEYASVAELTENLNSERYSSVILVKHLLNRIHSLDTNGPAINAIIELNPNALDIAAARDQERLSGQLRGPLHGIPVLIKDNIQTSDNMQTSAGSLALVGQPATEDAFIIQQLREAGAVILGKTNLTELAGFRDPDIPSGWSARGGQTKNPHKLSADPCGSSTGSAAAAAAGFAPLTVGTETNGSIHCPSFMNGVVGLKPSLGLLSRSGIILVSRNQDTPGPITRTVRDAALLLNAMMGNDPTDNVQRPHTGVPTDYTSRLNTAELSGKRIGYPSRYAPGSTEVERDANFAHALEVMTNAGATLIPVEEPSYENSSYMERYQEFLFMDLNREAPNWFSSRQSMPVNSIEELVNFNQHSPGSPAYGQSSVLSFINTPYNETQYNELWTTLNTSSRQIIDNLLAEHSLDALVDSSEGFASTIVPVAGYPGITVPSGIDDQGTLKGLYIYGARWSEARILGLAYSYEHASQARLNPAFAP